MMSATARPDGSETMSPNNDSSTSQKRKSEDSAPQQRAKRNRYISIACYVGLQERNWSQSTILFVYAAMNASGAKSSATDSRHVSAAGTFPSNASMRPIAAIISKTRSKSVIFLRSLSLAQ